MLEYLVINHLYGNYYVTDGDPKEIEAVCEQCLDYDRIIACFDNSNEEDIVRAILPCCYAGAYLSEISENEEEAFKDWLEFSGYTEYDEYLKDDIIDSFDSAISIADYLYKQGDISKNVCDLLKNLISLRKQKWLDILAKFDFSVCLRDGKILTKMAN